MFDFISNKENRSFLRLWLAQFISQFGERIYQLALVGFIAERSASPIGSAMDLAKLMAFTIIPVFIVQPIAGVYVDRWDRRITLFVCDIIRGLLVLSIPLYFINWNSIVPIYLVVFVVFCFSRFYLPAKMSIIPEIVHKDNLLVANSIATTSGMIAFVFGCALGGFLIEHYGARDGFIIDAVCFFASAAFVFSITIPGRLRVNKKKIVETSKHMVGIIKTSIWDELRESCVFLWRQPDIRFILGIIFVVLACAGAVYVVIIVFIQETFGSITKDLGVLAVCLGVGLFCGVLLYGKLGKKFPWYNVIFFCLLLGGGTLAIFALSVYNFADFKMTAILSVIMGVMIGPIFIAANTVIQLVGDEKMHGKIFSSLEIVIHVAFLIAMFISSWLAGFIPKVWILVNVGFICAGVGIIGFIFWGRGKQKNI